MGCLKMDISDQYFTALKVVKETSENVENTRAGSYRFGFNGMEADDEIAGVKNSYTAEYWQYDPRIGRRWNTDPVFKPWESRYATFSNNPVYYIDPLGLQSDEPNYANQPNEEDIETNIGEVVVKGKLSIWGRIKKSFRKLLTIDKKIEKQQNTSRRIKYRKNILTIDDPSSVDNPIPPDYVTNWKNEYEIDAPIWDVLKFKAFSMDFKYDYYSASSTISDYNDLEKEKNNSNKVTTEKDIEKNVNEQNRQVHGKMVKGPIYFIPSGEGGFGHSATKKWTIDSTGLIPEDSAKKYRHEILEGNPNDLRIIKDE